MLGNMKKKRDLCNEDIYQEVADELGIPYDQVKSIIEEGQSKFTATVMKSNTFDSVRWPYAGIFKIKPKAVQIVNHVQGLNPIQREQFIKNLKDGKVYNKED